MADDEEEYDDDDDEEEEEEEEEDEGDIGAVAVVGSMTGDDSVGMC